MPAATPHTIDTDPALQRKPRKPREADPDVQLRRAQQLARTFLRDRILADQPGDVQDITTYVMELYDADGFNRYLSWLNQQRDLMELDSTTTQVEIQACLAGYAFGLAVGSLVGPTAFERGGAR